MSSSTNITGLLAQLINGTTESPTPSTSVRNLNPVSLSTAYNRFQSQYEVGRITPPINPTKKAIILGHVDDSPTTRSAAGTETGWFATMHGLLPTYNLSDTLVSAISETNITNYPRYYIWILPDNLSSDSVIPIVTDGQVTNISRFPICSVKDDGIDTLLKGALVRIDFENRLLKSDAYVINVMNNTELFQRTLFVELEGIASAAGQFEPCDEQGVAVNHALGDALGALANDFQSDELIYIDGDAIYPYVENMRSADLIVFYHGIETGKSPEQHQDTILAKLIDRVPSGKLFLIPQGHNKDYSSVKRTIQEFESTKSVTIGDKKLGFWSGGAHGGRTALEQESFSKVEIADPTPEHGTMPASILTIGSNINMVYNTSNWGTPDYYVDNIDSYVSSLSNHGATVTTSIDNHTTIMEKAIERLIQ
jgi:hypothetical protein